jgi:4-amino-4-deoxy-L-arabinose transferase-like glycosyltransferase
MHASIASVRWHSYLSAILSAKATFCLISVVVVLLFWAVLPSAFAINENTDYDNFYEPVARNVLAGKGFIDGNGSPALAYPPGFPLVLAGVFHASEWLGVSEGLAYNFFTLLCVGASSALLWSLSALLWGGRAAGIALILWIFYPPMLWSTKQPNSETVFLLPLFAALLFYAKVVLGTPTAVNALATGVLAGMAMLIRPIAIAVVVPLIVGLCVSLRKERKIRVVLLASAVILGNLTVIVPWEYWMYSNTGRLIPLSSSGVRGIVDGLTFALSPPGSGRSIEVDRELLGAMEIISDKSRHITSFGDVMVLQASYFAEHPSIMVRLYAHKMLRSWYATNSGRQETALMVIQLIYLPIIVAGGLAALKFSAASRRLAIVILLVVLYFWAMTMMALSILRYMVPAMGLLMTLTPGALRYGPLSVSSLIFPSDSSARSNANARHDQRAGL